MHEFFDGNPIIQKRIGTRNGWLNLGYGLAFARSLGEKSALILSAEYYSHVYWETSPRSHVFNDITNRYVFFFELDWARRFLQWKGLTFSGIAGFNFRLGQEFNFVGYRLWAQLEDEYKLRDPGINGGLLLVQQLPFNLLLSGEAKFTQYLWRYTHSKPGYPINPANRSTRNMLTMQIGLGYRF